MDYSVDQPPYCGRFAPSPTGPLHFGSLLAALGSYLQARASGGRWLVRMEDIDPPREVAGAKDSILRSQESHGLYWDDSVIYQSGNYPNYQGAVEQLLHRSLAYPCDCSRRTIKAYQIGHGGDPQHYPGICRGRRLSAEDRAIRITTDGAEIRFFDPLQGDQYTHLGQQVGDFVIRRNDGLYSYQLAVAIDDTEQGITEVVRGLDLIDSTPRQIHIQHLLNLTTPNYCHLPIVVDPHGKKLAKQTHAKSLDDSRPSENLCQVLNLLGQHPPQELFTAPTDELLGWAIDNWSLDSVPRGGKLPLPTPLL